MDSSRPSERFPRDEFLNEPLTAADAGQSAGSGEGWPAAGQGSGAGWVEPGTGTYRASPQPMSPHGTFGTERREPESLIGPSSGSGLIGAGSGSGRVQQESDLGRVRQESDLGRVHQESGSGRSPGARSSGRQKRHMIGRYEIHSELGRGAFATVYLARIPGLERNFALKLLTPGADQVDEARFTREAQIAARLDHPGIVPVLDFGVETSSGRSFLVMEHVPGQTLKDRLEREGSLPWPEALAIVAELAAAIEVAHAAGVLHRDLKPDNVLMDARGGRPRVCDFGLARADDLRSTLSQAGEAMGTPVYMAPEQVRGEDVTSLADVYGLGMILYTLLTGTPPYVGSTVSDTFTRVTGGGAPAPSRSVPGIPKRVDALVLRAIHLDPQRRPASAEAFATELQAVAAGGGGSGFSARGPLGLALALGVLCVLLGTWALLAERRASELAERIAALEASPATPLTTPLTTPLSATETPAPSARPSPSPRDGGGASPASLEAEVAALRKELKASLDDSVRPALAPRELLVAFERMLPVSPATRALRSRLLANLGREREALQLLAQAGEEPTPDPTLLAYQVELLIRFRSQRPTPELQGAIGELTRLAPPGSAPERYARCLRQRRFSPADLEELRADAERFEEPYLWAFLAQVEGAQAAQAMDAAGLGRSAGHWRRYLMLDPGDATAQFKLSEALYYQHGQTRDERLIPEIQAALRRSRDLVPRPVMWSFTGKSQVTLEHRPRTALRELREALRRARARGDESEAHRAAGWLVVAHLLLGEDQAARDLAEGLRAAYPKGVYRQLRGALPESLRPRLAELLREGSR